ncbi:MAG: methylated-DNA--[protein]-cysteine S-methyltransferase [Gallionella sp.]|nr:methylated-DNA--[protein]-cysteine S-methyltransferase [Gallionella sp.]
MQYQAKISAPFGVLGIRCDDAALYGIDFLPPAAALQPPQDALARQICGQIERYLEIPCHVFDLPLRLNGTAHQLKVWHAMQRIPCGETRAYGALAAELHSAPRAVGQACGANPLPIVVPCHRVLGKAGLGGFMHHAAGAPLQIKQWLLAHEQR